MPGRRIELREDAASKCVLHLLDVGTEDYGDSILCEFGSDTVLIDGAHPGDDQGGSATHPSIPTQLSRILGGAAPHPISLLIVTHAHADHIGCLPALVDREVIRPEWALVADPQCRWGAGDSLPDDRARALAAALHEEVPANPTDAEIDTLLSDAERLRPKYEEMLRKLATSGTKIVRHGTDDPAPLLRRFRRIGLRIHGPSAKQLRAASALIRGRTDALAIAATDLLGALDAPDATSAYRTVLFALQSDGVALDAFNRNKGAINDTSIVASFKYAGRKILTTGDMQLEKPEVTDRVVQDEITLLRRALARSAPWDFVKLSHHGSYNGFSEALWNELKRPTVLGLCTGSRSSHHPNPETLAVLKRHRREIQWARTDRNGHTSFTWRRAGAVRIDPNRGTLDDATPNRSDVPAEGVVEGRHGEAAAASVATRIEGTGPAGGAIVEVVTRVPAGLKVTVIVDAGSRGGEHGAERPVVSPPLSEAGPPPASGGDVQAPRLGGGRTLPRLLFATNRAALSRNIGVAETRAMLDEIGRSGHLLLDGIPSASGQIAQALQAVRAELSRDASIKGIVLLGGYDVVAPIAIDALPDRLRRTIGDSGDPDRFIVWSDDGFGDVDADGLPEVPVSRIPDGLSSALMFAAIQATDAPLGEQRRGLRNMERPFADAIYEVIPGTEPMLRSRPTTYDRQPHDSLDGQRIYLMLHGDSQDGTRFWGEDEGSYPVAMTLSNVPERPGMVAFTGCCWGALAGDPPAGRWRAGQPLHPRTADTSLALQFLAKGGRAFVGCTGVHYSPGEDGNGGGGPMHRAFWDAYNAGAAPAEALFIAKATYMKDLPHGVPRGSPAEAIEFKILREYTCLGLGW